MKFYKNIGIFISIITLIVIILNLFFYTSFYNQQLKSHSTLLSKQAKLCGIQAEDNINDFKNDLSFYFNKYDFYELFKEQNIQGEAIRKLRQFFIKYNDLVSSIDITDTKGNTFSFNGNTENYFKKTYSSSQNYNIQAKNFAFYNSENEFFYTSALKDGNNIIANIRIKIELKNYFEIAFKQYHINNQYFQSLINDQSKIIYHNLNNKNFEFSNIKALGTSVNQNFENLINQQIIDKNTKENIITAIYPIDILGYKYGLAFSEKKSVIYDIVIRKSGLISFITILTFIIIIIIFQNLVKTLKRNEIKLKQTNSDLEQLTFSTSHHLQEPLRKIFLFSDRLSQKINQEENTKETELLKKIQNIASTMRQMLDGLLSYSDINLKGNSFESIDLNLLILSIISKNKNHLIFQENIFVNTLPDIFGDKEQIANLFDLIIENSIMYASKKQALKIEIFEGEKLKDYYQIIIKDNGLGFEQKFNELIFQPFQQLIRDENNHKNGIGLTLARKITERQGGRIYAEGMPEKGCKIIIEFLKKNKNG